MNDLSEKSQATSDPLGQKRPLILIIDDVQDHITILAQHLVYCGYSVIAARDGLNGLMKAEKERPDLIMLDICMPGIDGYETCRRLKKQKTTCETPVIFMTNLANSKNIPQAFEAGGDDYISKPYIYLEISARIKTHLRNRELISETKSRFQTIFQKSPLGVVITRASDNIMLDVNDAFLEIHGLAKRENVIGFTSRQLNFWFDQRDRDKALALLAKDGELRQYEMKYPRKNGETGYILLAAGKVFLDGEECILWIIRDITIRKEMEKKLLASTQRLIEMEEELRRDIAAEIHDEVGPDLTAIGFNLNIISKLIPVDARNIEENRVKLNDTKELIEHLHRSLRGIMTMLRPPLLDDYGLVSALKWHTERFSQRTRIEVDMQARDDFPRLDRAVELGLFRITHEALTNILKHAQTEKAYIIIKSNKMRVKLVIHDAGKGFHPGAAVTPSGNDIGGWGLGIMRERAELMGGCLTLDAATGKGVTITVNIVRGEK